MSVELMEPRDRKVKRRRPLAAVAKRVKKTGRRYPAASNGLFSIFDQAIVSGTGFLTAMFVGRTMSPDQVGTYYLALSVILLVSGVQDKLVMSPYVVYSKRRHGEELAEYAASVWRHQWILTLSAVAGLAVAIMVGWLVGALPHLGVWVLLVAAPLLMLRDSIRRFTFANLRVKRVIQFDVILAATQLGGLAALALAGVQSIGAVFTVIGSACALASIGWYLFDRPQLKFTPNRYLSDWRENWKFGKWALRSFLVGNTTPYIMLWILSIAAGAAAGGVLGACTTIVGATNVVLMGVANVLTPQAAQAYAKGGAKDLRRVLLRTAAFFALILGTFSALVLATGDWLPVLLFGPNFQGSGAILFTLSISMFMTGMGIVSGNGLWAIDRLRPNFFADVCCMVVTLICAALLIRQYDALGAALSTLAGTFTSAVVRTIMFVRHLERSASATSVAVETTLSS